MQMRNIVIFILITLLTIDMSCAAYTINGHVKYRDTDGTLKPVPYAYVDFYNSTWGYHVYADANGYYSQYVLGPGLYSVTVTKEGYITSNFIYNANSNEADYVITIDKETLPNYVLPHYVAFDVRNFFGTEHYSNVDVIVYNNGSIVETGQTGSNGVYGALLSENIYYDITFENGTQNIDRTWSGYPVDTKYDIIVFNAGFRPEPRVVDDILFGITSGSYNTTKGYINASYNDTSATTIRAKLFINDTNGNPLYYQSLTDDTGTFSQLVDATNNTYVVTFWIDNAQLEEPLVTTRIINLYNEPKIDLGWDENWEYIAISVLIIIGIVALFTTRNAEIGAIIGVMAGWFFLWLGWSVMGMTIAQVITVGLMLLLGTLIAYGAYIRGDY